MVLMASNIAMWVIAKERGVSGLCGVGSVSWRIWFHSTTMSAVESEARSSRPVGANRASMRAVAAINGVRCMTFSSVVLEEGAIHGRSANRAMSAGLLS